MLLGDLRLALPMVEDLRFREPGLQSRLLSSKLFFCSLQAKQKKTERRYMDQKLMTVHFCAASSGSLVPISCQAGDLKQPAISTMMAGASSSSDVSSMMLFSASLPCSGSSFKGWATCGKDFLIQRRQQVQVARQTKIKIERKHGLGILLGRSCLANDVFEDRQVGQSLSRAFVPPLSVEDVAPQGTLQFGLVRRPVCNTLLRGVFAQRHLLGHLDERRLCG